MKPILILLLVVVAFSATAQDKRYDFKFKNREGFKLNDNSVWKDLLNKQTTPDIIFKGFAQQQPQYLTTTKFGPLYALPLDNMPCLMPDVLAYNTPNGATDYLLRNPIDRGIYFNKPYKISVITK